MRNVLTKMQLDMLAAAGHLDLIAEYAEALNPYETFEPRPDDPADWDQQTSFVNDTTSKFAICLGGNRAGKTYSAAYKTAKYLRETEPMRERCPFWILGETFEMVTTICWDENLRQFIEPRSIKEISWYDKKRNLPATVILKWPDDINKPANKARPGWSIEFKSYDQGVALMQGRSIGGFWFNEEAPLNIVQEVQVRCANYDAPGWADFTPIHTRDPIWQDLYDDPPKGWKFYHLNLLKNRTRKIQAWAETYLPSIPEDERETRRIGVFASYVGQVFKEFRRDTNVVDRFPNGTLLPPADWWKIRGIDFGFGQPFCCLWVARDHDGRYWVYDEHYESGRPLDYHIERMKERPWKYNVPYYSPVYCDSEDPEAIYMLKQAGIETATPATEAKKPGAVKRRISELRRMMMVQGDGKPALYILSKCKNLVREIRGYHWALPIGKDLRKHAAPEVPVKWDDHSIDAMAYAIYTDWLIRQGRSPRAVRQAVQERKSIQFRGGREDRR